MALVLHRALMQMEDTFGAGERNVANLLKAGKEAFLAEPGARLDYLEIVNPDSLDPITDFSKPALVAVAAFIGNTRLIDNVLLAT